MQKTLHQAVLDVENLLHLAIVKSDVDGLISICSDDISVTNELGIVLTSPLQLIRNDEYLQVHFIKVRQREIKISLPLAVVLCEEEHHFTLYGQRMTTRLRCNRVWKFNGQVWHLYVNTIHAIA